MTPAIKLIIWDLDDTLWHGTLADGEEVRLHHERVAIVRTLNERGLVSALVSKNDPVAARRKLEELGIWDAFVFPKISFSPKGEVVRQLIADMQLRPANVLFVDDNRLNLEEVKWAVPGIHVTDASKPGCDALLADIAAANTGTRKSRVEHYRLLERKTADREATAGSQDDFLRSCDIRVVAPRDTDNYDFAERIAELANRSNQLNYTGSRFAPGEINDLLARATYSVRCWSLFARDRYGSHGLVGFAATRDRRTLEHFFFSCRIMHMGLEAWLLDHIAAAYPEIDLSVVPLTPARADWITELPFAGEVRADLLAEQASRDVRPVLRVMADCQSAPIAHYAGLIARSETDLKPRVFKIRTLWRRGAELPSDMPPFLVYGAFNEYKDSRARRPAPDEARAWTNDHYDRLARKFARLVEGSERRMIVVLAPENSRRYQHRIGVTLERVQAFNGVWRSIARKNLAVTTLELTALDSDGKGSIDGRHYRPHLLEKIGAAVHDWFTTVSAKSPITVPDRRDIVTNPAALSPAIPSC